MGRVPDSRRPRRRQALAPEGAPDAARGQRDHDGQHDEQRDGDGHRDQEAREPGRGVGALERVLLAGGTEDMPEAVDDELDPQQERNGGQHEGRGPQVATEPAVEEARGHEAAGQARVIEPFQADQPGPVFGAVLVEGWVGARAQRAGPDEHRTDPRPRLADQVHCGVHGDPELLEGADELRIVVGGQDGDH
jgi:hypothetical protein